MKNPGYGSEQHGLLCGYLFEPASDGRPVGLADALAWLNKEGAPGFVWLHFNLADASAKNWIQTHLALAPEFFEALLAGSRSTRIEHARDTLIAVVNDVAF